MSKVRARFHERRRPPRAWFISAPWLATDGARAAAAFNAHAAAMASEADPVFAWAAASLRQLLRVGQAWHVRRRRSRGSRRGRQRRDNNRHAYEKRPQRRDVMICHYRPPFRKRYPPSAAACTGASPILHQPRTAPPEEGSRRGHGTRTSVQTCPMHTLLEHVANITGALTAWPETLSRTENPPVAADAIVAAATVATNARGSRRYPTSHLPIATPSFTSADYHSGACGSDRPLPLTACAASPDDCRKTHTPTSGRRRWRKSAPAA